MEPLGSPKVQAKYSQSSSMGTRRRKEGTRGASWIAGPARLAREPYPARVPRVAPCHAGADASGTCKR